MTRYLFTDGGAIENGKKSCRAAWGVFFEDNHPLNETGAVDTEPSNQKAELYAIYTALRKYDNNPDLIDTEAVIVTDSQYSINCLTKWYKGWEKNGWQTYKKEPVKHVFIIKGAVELAKKHNVRFLHVNSHRIAPFDKSSEEYKQWYGNFRVDQMVSQYLSENAPVRSVYKLPAHMQGKPLQLSWDDTGIPVIAVGTNAPAEPKKEKIVTRKRVKVQVEPIILSW